MTTGENPYVDCRRLGLRCVDCLPRSQWCDLCTERHPAVVYLPNEPWPFSYVCLGWLNIVNRLVNALDDAAPGWRVTQIKEKFGTLTFSVTLPDGLSEEQRGHVYSLLRAAEEESGTVCDVCGAPGTMHVSKGWARTRCDEHKDLIPRDLTDPDAVVAKIEFPEGEEYRPPWA